LTKHASFTLALKPLESDLRNLREALVLLATMVSDYLHQGG